jgi:hypothetical protein
VGFEIECEATEAGVAPRERRSDVGGQSPRAAPCYKGGHGARASGAYCGSRAHDPSIPDAETLSACCRQR